MPMTQVVRIVVGAVVLAQAPKPAELSGDWVVETSQFDATEYRRVSLQQKGSDVSATMTDGRIEGTFKDGKLELRILWNEGPNSTYSAKLRGAELVGDGKNRNGD